MMVTGVGVNIIQNFQESSFCGMMFTICRLMAVEVIRVGDMRQETSQENTFNDFG